MTIRPKAGGGLALFEVTQTGASYRADVETIEILGMVSDPEATPETTEPTDGTDQTTYRRLRCQYEEDCDNRGRDVGAVPR